MFLTFSGTKMAVQSETFQEEENAQQASERLRPDTVAEMDLIMIKLTVSNETRIEGQLLFLLRSFSVVDLFTFEVVGGHLEDMDIPIQSVFNTYSDWP